MTLYVKNMVCQRCISVVTDELKNNGVKPVAVRMGEVDLVKELSADQMAKIDAALKKHGFEVLDDRRKKLIQKIKTLLIKKVQDGEIEEHFKLSDYLASQMNKDYSSLSKLFSEVEGITIENFFILQKIEKIKEWIAYDELILSEIAWKLGYSSLAHLSAQFKKVTGLNPSHFKKIGLNDRKSLDSI
jgi:AraC family transcriptional regulator